MKRVSFVAVTLGLAGAFAIACGSDDDPAAQADLDAGSEGGAGTDATSSQDASAPDTSIPDTSTPDTSTPDTGADGGTSLDGGACTGAAVTVSGSTPPFAWTGAKTPLTITGINFEATPKVYLRAGAGALTPIQHVAFVSSTSLTAVVPTGIPVGTYDVAVANPNGCAGTLAAGLKVLANAAPIVLDVSPAAGTTQSDVPITVTGCHFPANATVSTVASNSTVVVMTNAAPVAGANDARCANTPLYTMAGTIQVKTKGLTAGPYLVRVANPTDATYGDYASFVVTNPSGNLTGGWIVSPPLVTGRRALGVVAGRVDDANRFVYAIAGEAANGALHKTVEVAPLDRFGALGKWFVQKNQLLTARSGVAVARHGRWIYVVGGTDDANGSGGAVPSGDPLDSIERAKILDTSFAPIPTDPPVVSTAAGTLAAGTWYYRVASVGADADDPGGESIASDEIVANLAAKGTVSLSWPTIAGATSYKVYRSAISNGISGSEVFLANVAAALGTVSYADDGSAAPTPTETYLPIGSTGKWEQTASTIGGGGALGRSNAAAVIANDPNGDAFLYVIGGWGRCSAGDLANAVRGCIEYAKIDAATGDLGAFTLAGSSLANPRMRASAAAMTRASGPPGFEDGGAASTAAFLVVAGGRGTATLGSATNVEHALVAAGGAPGAWALPGSAFAGERDGLQFQIANGYAYAFQGGAPASYTATSDQSARATVGPTSITFANWNNAGANLGGANKLGRHGLTSESAYFYLVGGTSNDADALTTVFRILH